MRADLQIFYEIVIEKSLAKNNEIALLIILYFLIVSIKKIF